MSQIEISWILSAQFPKALAEFYAFATHSELQKGISEQHWMVFHKSRPLIELFKASVDREFPRKGSSFALCLRSAPASDPRLFIDAWSEKLIGRGATVLEKPVVQFFGVESWLADPEGNHFCIVVPNIEKAHKS